MKPLCSKQRNQALTLVELLLVIVLLAIFAAMLTPANGGKRKAIFISCANNLKQVGIAYKVWAGEHNDKYPMDVVVTNGGTMELMDTADAWKAFQVMSNELSTPRVLYCHGDSSRDYYATNFGEDLKTKISYFIGLDTTGTNAMALLSGDDNFLLNHAPVKPGLVNVSSTTPIEWDTTRHDSETRKNWFIKTKIGTGNLLLDDGSVQGVTQSGLTNQLQQTGLATNRLAIP